MGLNGVNQQLSTVIERTSFMRTGTVVLVDPFKVSVDVGETVMRAAYTRVAEPVIGDVVVVMRQGASWFVIGTSSASGANLVENASFEDVNPDGTPVGWTLQVSAGLMTFQAHEDPIAVDGLNIVDVFNPGAVAAASRLYSRAISVDEGAVMELSVYANGLYPTETSSPTVDVLLQAYWFANATDLYPTTSAADSTLVTVTDITEEDTMRIVRGTVTVPVGAVFMRVGLRTVAPDPLTGASYEYATARAVV